jgi:hypothetical protein
MYTPKKLTLLGVSHVNYSLPSPSDSNFYDKINAKEEVLGRSNRHLWYDMDRIENEKIKGSHRRPLA